MIDRLMRAAVALLLMVAMLPVQAADAQSVAAARAIAANHPGLAPLESTGDLARMIEERRALRGIIDSVVQQHNPTAAAALRAPIDEFFAADAIAEQLAALLSAGIDPADLEAQTMFAASPARQAIHRALRDFDPSKMPAMPPVVSDARRDLLAKLATATEATIEATIRPSRMEWLHAALTDAVVPDSAQVAAVQIRAASGLRGISGTDLVDPWFAPALMPFDDEAIADYLLFAQSKAGKHYFSMRTMPYAELGAPWFKEVADLVAKHAKRVPARVDDVDALLAEIDAAFAATVYPRDIPVLRARLLAAESAAPKNAGVQERLALLALWARGARESDDQLRPPLPLAGRFEETDLRVERALAIDPHHAGALAIRARSYFFQHRDAEARVALDRSRKADPANPWLDIYEADLLQAEGKHEPAIALYERVAAAPDISGGARLRSIMASRGAYVAAQRGEDFTKAALHFLETRQDHPNLRMLLAWHMIETKQPRERVMTVLGPLRDGPAKAGLVQMLEAQSAAAAIDSGEDASVAAKAILEAARRAPGGVPAMVSQTCMSEGGFERAMTLAEISGEKDALSSAIGCATLQREASAIARLVRQGGDVNVKSVPQFGERPLTFAATFTSDVDTVRALLAAGADPSLKEPGGRTVRERLAGMASDNAKAIVAMLDASDASGAAAAAKERLVKANENIGGLAGLAARIDAVCAPHADSVMLDEAVALVETGQVPPAEVTRLFGCSLKFREPPIEVLARHGADLDAPSIPNFPGSPLMRAVEYDEVAQFERLLAAGADPSLPLRGNMTLRDVLVRRNTPQTAQMLQTLDRHTKQ